MSALAVSIFRARLVTTEFVAYVCGRHLDKFLQQLHLIFYGLCTDQCLEHALPIALKYLVVVALGELHDHLINCGVKAIGRACSRR